VTDPLLLKSHFLLSSDQSTAEKLALVSYCHVFFIIDGIDFGFVFFIYNSSFNFESWRQFTALNCEFFFKQGNVLDFFPLSKIWC
jgi:hypothetical protein